MNKYILILIFTFLYSPAFAKDNKDTLNIVYNTKIAGIHLKSTEDDINNALSKQDTPMDCKTTDFTKKSRYNNRQPINYKDWNCQYTNGQKYKFLKIGMENNKITYIEYRGSIFTSLDSDNMINHYKKLNDDILSSGRVHNKFFKFNTTTIPIANNSNFTSQNMWLKSEDGCDDINLSPVILDTTITHRSDQDLYMIEIKYNNKFPIDCN